MSVNPDASRNEERSMHGTAGDPTIGNVPVATVAPSIKHNVGDATTEGHAGDAEPRKTARPAIKAMIGPAILVVAVLIGVLFVWNRLAAVRRENQEQAEISRANFQKSRADLEKQREDLIRPIPEQPRFTLSHYAKLRDGMTYEEVCKILGDNGVEAARSSFGGVTSRTVGWVNSDGSSIHVGFRDDRVVTLLQTGLR